MSDESAVITTNPPEKASWYIKTGHTLESGLDNLCKILNILGITVLVAMTVMTVFDVIGRLFKRPIIGSTEITELMMVAITFLCLGWCAIKGRMITVDLITMRLSSRVRTILNCITLYIGLGVLIVIVRQSWLSSLDVQADGIYTQILKIPHSPFMWILTFGFIVLCLVVFRQMLVNFFAAFKRRWHIGTISFIAAILMLVFIYFMFQETWPLPDSIFSKQIVGLLAIVVMCILMFMGMWIGLAMAVCGFLFYAYMDGLSPSLLNLGAIPFANLANYNVTPVPLFVFMGALVTSTGISSDLFDTAYKWLGSLRGGLAQASVVACAAFAAICGSSMAAAITMGKVTLPEMKKYRYNDSLATAVVASGGTLGVLIPPSMGFIMYGIITENSVGALFMAGIIPGIILTLLFMVVVAVRCWRNPMDGPSGPKTTIKEKIVSLKGTWMMLCLFVLVLGGIYLGFFTPTESGAVGAAGALIITLATRRLTRRNLVNSMLDTGMITAATMFIITGSFIFMRMLAVSQLPTFLADFVGGLALSRYAIIAVIVVFYVIVGMFLEITSATVFTVPILYPLVTSMGFDPIWFGVIIVIVIEMGMITPPIGLNVFVLGSSSGVPMDKIFKGVYPFVGAMLVLIAILTFFPQVALFLPGNM